MSEDQLKMYANGLKTVKNSILATLNDVLTTLEMRISPEHEGTEYLPAEWDNGELDRLTDEEGLALQKLVNVPGSPVIIKPKGRPGKRKGGSHYYEE